MKTKADKMVAVLKAIEAFDFAAKDWGWTSDWGVGDDVTRSKNTYDATKKNLIAVVRRYIPNDPA